MARFTIDVPKGDAGATNAAPTGGITKAPMAVSAEVIVAATGAELAPAKIFSFAAIN